MKNPNIATVLKYYRKLNHLSVNEVSDILKEQNNYAAPKTIYGWESGQTQPDADTLMFLCDLYHIEDVLETFGYKQQPSTDVTIVLSEKEKILIESYRKHPNMHPAVDRLLELEQKMKQTSKKEEE